MIKRLLLFLIIFYSLPTLIFAGTTGKLTGHVKDAETGEAIPGVNVIFEGTTFGSATDIEGFYIINNLPPGNYNVRFSAVGYQKKQFVNVKIAVDFTTEIDVDLSTESIELETVVIEAEAPLIRRDLTSSHTTIDATQIESLPVESIGQILTLQAGIVQGTGGELHIRGGRSTEISYTVNGVSINNPYDNSRSVNIATNAIQELSVVSGTFNAEYGNALSGIVNTITKEGGNSYRGKISVYTGDNLSSRKNPFYNINDFDPLNNYVGEATISGPLPLLEDNLSFFLSGRYNDDKGWLYGIRQHLPTDYIVKNELDPNDIKFAFSDSSLVRDNAIIPMNPSIDISATGKLTFKPTSTIKINYDAVYSRSEYKSYNHDYKYNPDASYNNYDWGLLNSLEIRHALNGNTFYTLRGSYNFNDYKQYLYPLLDASNQEVDYYPGKGLEGLHPNSNYMPSDRIYRASNYTFLSGGTQNNHFYQRSTTIGAKLDLTSQLNNNHEFKFGLEYNSYKLDYENFLILRDLTTYLEPAIGPVDGPNHDLYTKKPIIFSAYIQDKMEFEKLILNAGLRYDYFDADSKYSTDIFYPSPSFPYLPPSVDPNTLLSDVEPKNQISPRIGISFPITDQGIIHFSYGHFFQMPSFRYLYTNPNFEYEIAGSPTFGNAKLKPEKTVTYEIGLQQQLFEDLAFNVTGFYKDVRDLLALQQIRIDGDKTYFKYVNKDYANVKGITFSLTKRRTAQSIFGITLDYTFQVSEGNDVNSDAFFLDLSSGRQSEKIPVYLSWDQSHTLNTTVSVGQPNDWNISVVGRIGTGLPYTPEIITKQVFLRVNSGRRPSQANVDLLAEKSFAVLNYSLTVFLKVFNLFDILNERLVYSNTGRATYTLTATQGSAKATDEIADNIPGIHPASEYFVQPQFYLAPREVRLGASFEF